MNDFRSIMIWLARVLANALMGGLAFAVVGAFCGGTAALFMALLENRKLNEGSILAFIIGASIGAICGIAGIFIYLFPALLAKRGKFWQPLFDLVIRVSRGQILGTIAVYIVFIALELIRSQLNNARFFSNVNEDFIPKLLTFSAPTFMILGAVAAAIFKRD